MPSSIRYKCLLVIIIAVISAISGTVYASKATVSISATVRAGVCGDGIVEVKEECEVSELRARTCMDFGFLKGHLTCNSQCKFDIKYCFNPPLFVKRNLLELLNDFQYNELNY